MLKFCSTQSDWYRVAIISLCVTAVGGLLLRLQYAGIFTEPLGLDLRRAHSHLGFFGFLFPILWHELQKAGWWTPESLFKKFYIVLLFSSTFGFAVSGYGIISHISSALILMIWLVFAFKNLKSCQGILASVPISIILSALTVLVVAGASKWGLTISTPQLVRIFLFILLFGVFGSMIIFRFGKRMLHPMIWIVSTVGTGIFLANIQLSYLFSWAPLALGLSIFYCIHGMSFNFRKTENRTRGCLFIQAMTLLLVSFEILPNNHLTAISGIHFFVFLIVAPWFLVFRKGFVAILFEIASAVTAALLILPHFLSLNFFVYQEVLSLVSLIIVLLVFFGVKFVNREFVC